eukprot:gene33219-42956_t
MSDDSNASNYTVSYKASTYVQYGNKLYGNSDPYTYSAASIYRSEENNNSQRKVVLDFALYFLCLSVVAIDLVVLFLGDFSISKGVTTIQNSLTSLQTTFSAVNVTVSTLGSFSAKLNSDVVSLTGLLPSTATSKCQLPSTIYQSFQSYLSDYNTATNKLLSFSGPVLKVFRSVLDTYIPLYAQFYRDIVLYVLWALSIACVLIIVPSHIFKSKGAAIFGVVVTVVTFLLYLLTGVLWLIMTEVGGALCMGSNPAYSIASNNAAIKMPIPFDNTTQRLVKYYSSCKGSNPMEQYVSASATLVSSLKTTLSTYCLYGDPSLNSVIATAEQIQYKLGNMSSQVNRLRSNIACSGVQRDLLGVINSGLCGDFYSGIFIVWGGQLIISFVLFWLVVVVTIVWQYYSSDGDEKVYPHEDEHENDAASKIEEDPEAAESDSNGREILPPVIAEIDTTVKPTKDPITPPRKNTSQVEEFVL